MSVGTGIFLSAIFLGLILLYIYTRDRWRWRRIILWPLGFFLLAGTIGGIWFYADQVIDRRPQKITEFWGIKLGASRADVLFLKGEPSAKRSNNNWSYKPYSSLSDVYTVYFKEDRVSSILFTGTGGPTVRGLDVYASPDQMNLRFGPAPDISRSKDDLYRSYSFPTYNLALIYGRGKLDSYGLYDPITGPLVLD